MYFYTLQSLSILNIKLMSITKITGTIKDYHWGMPTQNSLVYNFSRSQKKYQKYAELWMGSHVSGPSYVTPTKNLIEFLNQNNQNQLKYLFKILSIQQCLSIQTHPNKIDSQNLHKLFPKIYPDPNDKPEMFLTLSKFKCLMGFIDDHKLHQLLQQQPFTKFQSKQLKYLIQEILKLNQQQIKSIIQFILQHKQSFKGRQSLIQKMQKQFPYDIGIIVSFLLQYHQFEPGYAYYIKAGQPHAYVQGECLELMKNSDNVVRLGLTPKLKDADTLLKILDYNDRKIQALKKENNVYKAGILRLYQILGNQIIELNSNTIGIVLEGNFVINGTDYHEKDIFIIFAGTLKIQGVGKLYLANSE